MLKNTQKGKIKVKQPKGYQIWYHWKLVMSKTSAKDVWNTMHVMAVLMVTCVLHYFSYPDVSDLHDLLMKNNGKI